LVLPREELGGYARRLEPGGKKRRWQTPNDLEKQVKQQHRYYETQKRPVGPNPYGIRRVTENDVERLAMMGRMGLTIQDSLKLLRGTLPKDGRMDRTLSISDLRKLAWKSEEAPVRQGEPRYYRIDARGRHSVYEPKFLETLGQVWLTFPKEFPGKIVELQMQTLREKGFSHHEVEVIRGLPHDRRTAIYLIVSRQTLPVRLEDCEDIQTSNDFETSEETDEVISKDPIATKDRGLVAQVLGWMQDLLGFKSISLTRKKSRVQRISLKDVALVKAATLKFRR